jgi:hypothetical protein
MRASFLQRVNLISRKLLPPTHQAADCVIRMSHQHVSTVHADFRPVAHEFGHSGRPLPTWASTAVGSPAPLNPAVDANVLCRDLSDIVPGCFQLLGALTPEECDAFVQITEQLGFDEDAPVSLPHSFRHMENVNWVVDTSLSELVWSRVAAALPVYAKQVTPGAEALGINQRFRVYKYGEGDYFKPHTDGSWPGSSMVDGELAWDAYGDRWSQYTFLILLSDGYMGGRTLFFVPDDDSDGALQARAIAAGDGVDYDGDGQIAVRTPKGAVLCFPHGGHPQHSLHAGERVESGCKYMVRTEILYRRTAEAERLQAGWFRSGPGGGAEASNEVK